MRTKILLISVIFSIVFSSCKNESKVTKDNEVAKEVKNDFFKVTLDVKVKKEDSFQLYYTENASENFSEEKSIWVNVKGSENEQKVSFNFSKDVIPSLIRLDFGVNKEQEDVIISGVMFEYFGKEKYYKIKEMESLFRPLEQTTIDFNTGIINAKNEKGERIEPVLHPHEVIIRQELLKIIQ